MAFRTHSNLTLHLYAVGLFAILVPVMGAHGLSADSDGKYTDGAAIVLDRYIAVTGGRGAYAKLINRTANIRVTFVGMGIESQGIRYSALPNFHRTEIQSEVFGKEQYGTDGDTVWHMGDKLWPMIEGGAARDANLTLNAFDLAWNWRRHYKAARLAGQEMVNGKLCDMVAVDLGDGKEDLHYFGKDSGLLLRTDTWHLESITPDRQYHIEFSDYRRVDGVALPHSQLVSFNKCGSQMKMLVLTEGIKHNTNLPDGTFDPPAEIAKVKAPNSPKVQAQKRHAGDTVSDDDSAPPKSSCDG